jgi:hypothetical protein
LRIAVAHRVIFAQHPKGVAGQARDWVLILAHSDFDIDRQVQLDEAGLQDRELGQPQGRE